MCRKGMDRADQGEWERPMGEGNKLELSTKPQSLKCTVIPVTMYANFNNGNKREGRKGEIGKRGKRHVKATWGGYEQNTFCAAMIPSNLFQYFAKPTPQPPRLEVSYLI